MSAQNAVDDRGHEPSLRRGGAGAADALNPLHFDLARGRVVEVFAIGQLMAAQRIEHDKLVSGNKLGLVVRFSQRNLGAVQVALYLHALMVRLKVPRHGHGDKLFEAAIHRVERGSDGHRRDTDADHQRQLLLPWR